jgi:hypothetical protein
LMVSKNNLAWEAFFSALANISSLISFMFLAFCCSVIPVLTQNSGIK